MTSNLTTDGVEVSNESIVIEHVVTDQDGGLKVIHARAFVDSRANPDLISANCSAESIP